MSQGKVNEFRRFLFILNKIYSSLVIGIETDKYLLKAPETLKMFLFCDQHFKNPKLTNKGSQNKYLFFNKNWSLSVHVFQNLH
jgi:hypothetical protein